MTKNFQEEIDILKKNCINSSYVFHCNYNEYRATMKEDVLEIIELEKMKNIKNFYNFKEYILNKNMIANITWIDDFAFYYKKIYSGLYYYFIISLDQNNIYFFNNEDIFHFIIFARSKLEKFSKIFPDDVREYEKYIFKYPSDTNPIFRTDLDSKEKKFILNELLNSNLTNELKNKIGNYFHTEFYDNYYVNTNIYNQEKQESITNFNLNSPNIEEYVNEKHYFVGKFSDERYFSQSFSPLLQYSRLNYYDDDSLIMIKFFSVIDFLEDSPYHISRYIYHIIAIKSCINYNLHNNPRLSWLKEHIVDDKPIIERKKIFIDFNFKEKKVEKNEETEIIRVNIFDSDSIFKSLTMEEFMRLVLCENFSKLESMVNEESEIELDIYIENENDNFRIKKNYVTFSEFIGILNQIKKSKEFLISDFVKKTLKLDRSWKRTF